MKNFIDVLKIPLDDCHYKNLKMIEDKSVIQIINDFTERLTYTYTHGTTIETFKFLYNTLCLFQILYRNMETETSECRSLLDKFMSTSLEYISFAESEIPPFEFDYFEKSLFHADILPLQSEYTIETIHTKSVIRFPDQYLLKIRKIVYRYYNSLDYEC